MVKKIKHRKRTEISKSNNTQQFSFHQKLFLGVKHHIWLIFILSITFIFYSKTFSFDFVYWDDDTYIFNNPYIKSFSLSQIKDIFSETYFANYHPLTTLSYLIEFQLFKYNANYYHIFNVILHLLNVLLVYIFIKNISQSKDIALITAFIFALHPMHVESVAWISERKDVLYTLFFLSSIIFYIKFLKNNYIFTYYLISIVLFIASLLSKSAAVTLPLVLLLLTFYIYKKIKTKDILYCIPFLLLSLIFGFIALYSQQEASGIEKINTLFNFFERILLVFYALSFYVVQFIFPHKFSTYHPYPDITNNWLPLEFYLSPFLIILFIILVLIVKNEPRRILIFGFIFFLFTIVLVIQLIPIGDTIVSERYTYVAYIGLGYIFGSLYSNYKKIVFFKILIICYLIFLSVSTFKQIDIWQNSNTLWDKVIDVYPESHMAYNNRGNSKAESGDFKGALVDLNTSISKNGHYALAYCNRARVLKEMNDTEGALKDYNKCIELDKKIPEAYNGRGVILASYGKFEEALLDLNKAVELKPDYSIGYNNRAGIRSELNDMEGALMDYDEAITLDPFYADAYCNKGAILLKNNERNEAIVYFNKAIALNPNFVKAYENMAILHYNEKDFKQSLVYFDKVTSLSPNYAQAFYFKGSIMLFLNDTNGACIEWRNAQNLGYTESEQALNAFCR